MILAQDTPSQSINLSYQDCVTESELLPEHLQEWLDSGVDLEIIILNVRSVRGKELFEILNPKVTATQSGTGIRAGKVRAKLDDCMESVALECHGRVKATHGPLAKKGKYLNSSGYYDKAGRYIKIACRPTFLRIPLRIWQKIADRYGVSIYENPVIDGDGAAIGFWAWVRDNNIPIKFAEGEKKAGCLLTLGYAAISLNGIWMGRRVIYRESDGKRIGERLHEDLQEFDTPGREITFAFDWRDGQYFQSVEFKAARATGELLQNAIAKIAILPGPDKGVDDFCVGGGDVDAVMSAARNIDEIQKQFFSWLGKETRKKAWALTHPIAWECHQRYLDIPYPESGLICIKSPKGSGKTYALRKLAAKAQAEGRKVGVLVHRIVLGRAICQVVEIPWIEEMNSDGDRKIEGKALGHGLCIDSLHATSQAFFDPLAWEGALIIIDEVEQVFWHALNSSTCKDNRQAILSSLKLLLQTVLNSGGQVLLQDADLSDMSIDFVREFSGIDVAPWIAVNHWQPSEPWQIKFYDTQHVKGGTKDDPSGLLKDSVDRVTFGGKIWVSTDSQKAKSKYGSKNLEKYYRSRCPGKKILRIDAETVANPEHPAYQCAEKIQGSEKIKDGLAALYDIVICSPSLATGVSVDLRGHFTAVFGIYQGATSDNEVRQSLARVREPVPRFVWCRQIAVGKVGNGESNYKAVATSKEKDCRYNLALLKDFDFDLDKAYNPVVLKFWAKYAARINSSIWNFREAVRDGLVAEGHALTDCGDDDRDTAGEIKTIRIISQVEEAVAVAEADDIDREEFEKLEQQRSKTDAERHQEEKFRLKEIYKVEVTPELRQLHQDKWFGKIHLEYSLTHNPDFVWMRDRKSIDSQIKSGDGQLCLQDVRQTTGKLKIHELLNILQFTDPTKEWSNKSPEILEFAGKALKLAADIKLLTGITVSPEKATKNPIGVVGSFLGQLGLKLAGEQRRVGEDRVRFYKFGGAASANCFDRTGNKISEPVGLRSEIFEAWQQRDELALFEFQQKGILAVEADVTVQSKSAQSKHSSDLTSKSESVTPHSINKEEISPVTTNSTVKTPPEQEAGSGSTAEKVWAWYQVKADWIKCRVLGLVGDCYRLEVKSMVGDGLAIFKAFPEDLRWEAPN
ncbi:plasmid replication protein, CyRepA1 family [Microcoleus sp. BROC3]|uniref:plasmid replication protein, CyRepA1 family n=1 Tax=Microcoleus sp. BROC3 TaxID=3055323 RepID=UPI002FCFB88B